MCDQKVFPPHKSDRLRSMPERDVLLLAYPIPPQLTMHRNWIVVCNKGFWGSKSCFLNGHHWEHHWQQWSINANKEDDDTDERMGGRLKWVVAIAIQRRGDGGHQRHGRGWKIWETMATASSCGWACSCGGWRVVEIREGGDGFSGGRYKWVISQRGMQPQWVLFYTPGRKF